MAEFFENIDTPSWGELISLNQELQPLFERVHHEHLSLLLFCLKMVVDENEKLSSRHLAKQKIYEFIEHFLPNEGLS